jgi:hypothetical protein
MLISIPGELPALMVELVGRRVTVLAATGGTISARAAKVATSRFRLSSPPGMIRSVSPRRQLQSAWR